MKTEITISIVDLIELVAGAYGEGCAEITRDWRNSRAKHELERLIEDDDES